MEVGLIKQFTLWLAAGTELLAAVVIAIGIIEAVWQIATVLLSTRRYSESSHEAEENVRLRFGRWLALALEFELGADILRTAVAPSWSDIGQLAAIAAIRTALNFFLQHEIDNATARRAAADDQETVVPVRERA
jgi:uncharacterized membrane protein